MFRPAALMLSVVFPLALGSAARAADDPKEIIAKAIKAHGGEEFLSKNKATQSKNKGKITIPGVGETEFTEEVMYMLPDKLKESLEMKIANQTINLQTLINGDKATVELNGKAIDLPDAAKDSIKGTGYLLQIGRLVPLLKEKRFELNLIGDDKVEGKEVVGVRVSAKDQKDVNLYFDKKTNLLAKIEHRTADPMTGMEVNEERFVLEYQKNKDGVNLPKKVLIKHDGKEFLQAEVLEIQFLEKIDENEFKK